MKYIEKGWQSYRNMVLPSGASDVQVKECRQAFYAGAAILLESIMATLDPGTEPTEADFQRMTNIQIELDEFGQQLDKRYLGAQEH
jgi:hypothetical protein